MEEKYLSSPPNILQQIFCRPTYLIHLGLCAEFVRQTKLSSCKIPQKLQFLNKRPKHLKGHSVPRISDVFNHKGFCHCPVSRHFPFSVIPCYIQGTIGDH